MFQLTEKEKQEVVANCDYLKQLEQDRQQQDDQANRKMIGFRNEEDA